MIRRLIGSLSWLSNAVFGRALQKRSSRPVARVYFLLKLVSETMQVDISHVRNGCCVNEREPRITTGRHEWLTLHKRLSFYISRTLFLFCHGVQKVNTQKRLRYVYNCFICKNRPLDSAFITRTNSNRPPAALVSSETGGQSRFGRFTTCSMRVWWKG